MVHVFNCPILQSKCLSITYQLTPPLFPGGISSKVGASSASSLDCLSLIVESISPSTTSVPNSSHPSMKDSYIPNRISASPQGIPKDPYPPSLGISSNEIVPYQTCHLKPDQQEPPVSRNHLTEPPLQSFEEELSHDLKFSDFSIQQLRQLECVTADDFTASQSYEQRFLCNTNSNNKFDSVSSISVEPPS